MGDGGVTVAVDLTHVVDIDGVSEVGADAFGFGVGEGEEVEVEVDAAVFAELPAKTRCDSGTEGGGSARDGDTVGVPRELVTVDGGVINYDLFDEGVHGFGVEKVELDEEGDIAGGDKVVAEVGCYGE